MYSLLNFGNPELLQFEIVHASLSQQAMADDAAINVSGLLVITGLLLAIHSLEVHAETTDVSNTWYKQQVSPVMFQVMIQTIS